jgi:hypothetical protein
MCVFGAGEGCRKCSVLRKSDVSRVFKERAREWEEIVLVLENRKTDPRGTSAVRGMVAPI